MNKARVLSAIGLCTLPVYGFAYDLPGINLGGTSFYDGAPPPQGPGNYLIEYLQFSTTDQFNGPDGKPLALPKQDLDMFVPLTQFIHLSDKKWLGGNIGLTALLPYVAQADMDDGLNGAAIDSNTGVGDLMVGAFLQFDPVMGAEGPIYAQRFEVDVSLPTGDYDASKTINPSSNSFYINPHYAITYWLSPKWTLTSRVSYLWNGKNDDPSAHQNLGAKETQAGQAIHVNFASAYSVTDKLSVGINGYALKQLTNTKVDGASVSGTKEKVWAIGPGLFYAFGQNDSLVANVYFEQGAENRAENERLILRFNHRF